MIFIRSLILKWIGVVILRNPDGKQATAERRHPHLMPRGNITTKHNSTLTSTFQLQVSTSEASSCPEAALPAALEAIMRAARSSNLQMFSTYRRVNQVRYFATNPLIIKDTRQYGCKPMVLIKMVVILDKCGGRCIELLARILIMRSM